METGTARYGPVRRVVWGPVANHHRLPDCAIFPEVSVREWAHCKVQRSRLIRHF
jgi:hypothetical protein